MTDIPISGHALVLNSDTERGVIIVYILRRFGDLNYTYFGNFGTAGV